MTVRLGRTYKEAKIEANDDGIGDGNGSELNVTKVTGKGLSNDVHGERCDAAENRGTNYVP